MTDEQTVSLIFLSTAIASQNKPADFTSISGIADGVNHAVPSHKELQDLIIWLANRGLIIKISNKYSLTDKGRLDYEDSSKNTKTVLEAWSNVEVLLKKYRG